jgi:ketosteroid isomerase-like protein
MLKSITPEELLNLQVKEFNKGNANSLMTLYENDACFASRSGQVIKGLGSIRLALQDFMDMRCKLEVKVKKVLEATNLALIVTEWSIKGIESDGKTVNLTGMGTVVLHQQSDGTWLIVIENPWGLGNQDTFR